MIFDNKILTEEEAMDVSNRVLSMREAFIDRGTFDTLGASVYLDDPLSYIELKDETNPLLKHNFDDLEVWPNLVTEEPEYVDYTAGHMYSHVGHVTHRIAGVGNPTDENPRITLQGHGAILSLSQEAVIYF